MKEVATSKISPQWSTTIPKEVRPWLEAGPGDEISWIVEDQTVVVRKKETEK